ncbi:MAG: response regulator [Candidatus Desulfatibia sp.]|uniref:response regulator n=1 Tax=Candidatus Desulfatibia sp. TaxID=3101189 RepID=UPI002F317196
MPNSPKVLIVDDDSRMCESLKALLSNQGYILKTCNSGKKAIEYLNNYDFDLVLLDIVIPDMNGYQIMDYITNQSPDTLVIVITGHASIKSAIKFIKKGAYDYIKKPFEPEELLVTVKNGLDHKRLESENEVINEKLIRTEECYRYLVKNSPDIIYMLDGQGNFKFISNTAERLLGFQIEQLIGEHYTTLIHDNDLEKAKWSFNERRTGDRAASQMELRLKVCGERGQFKDCKVGHLTIELKSNGIYDEPIKKEDKKFIGTHGVIRDISGRKQLEFQLKQAHKMEAIGTLTGGIAHEFNNILSIILGNTELALDDVPEWNPAHFNLEEIKTAGLRAKNVVRQLLSFIRKTDIKRQPISIISVIKDALKFLRSTITANIDIRQNIQDTADTVFADPTQINQIMINLCTNASHAMEETGGMLDIGIQNIFLDENSTALIDPELTQGNYVKVTVSDTGHGIAPETIERIFDPYFTTKEVGKGSGLGLSVVHGIVKIHRGAITVDSELGKGTTFNIFFPVTEEEVVTESKIIEELPTGNENILFVDDEESIVFIVRQMLERLGYQVEVKMNPVEALELFRSNPDQFDLVITDMAMPQMDGDKLVKEILNIRSEMPIILCTGFSEKVTEENAKELGIKAFTMKPLVIRDLAVVVRKVLDEE